MIRLSFLLFFCFATGQLVSSAVDECSKYATPVEKRIMVPPDDPSNTQGRAFQSLSFRANNYGSSRYKLEASFKDVFQLSIEMNNGPRPDSMKGGDLNGFYALDRSFITLRKDSKLDGKKTGLEIWNIYVRKNNSAEAPSAHNVVSLNVEFEIGDRPSNQINLITSAMKKLSPEEPKTMLSYNYDLYEFLPLQTSFGLYETTKFPFSYPQLPDLVSKKTQSACGPIIKVYRFNSPLSISKKQFDEFLSYEQQLKTKFSANGQPAEENEIEKTDSSTGEFGKIYLTPSTEHLLFRRLVAESYVRNPDGFGDDTHAGGPIPADMHKDDMDMDDDYEDDDELDSQEARAKEKLDPNDPNSILAHQKPIIPRDEENFPPDCVFLFKIHDELQQRARDRHIKKNSADGLSSIFFITIWIPITAFVVMAACN